MKYNICMKIIDNFDIIRSHLTFETEFDRYIIIILKRTKDQSGKEYGVNETNRRIKTFMVGSIDYFDKKIPIIKDLCKCNNARAYILPQVRHNRECLINLMKLTLENIDSPTIKPDTLITSAYAGNHSSRNKKWILDLDADNLTEYKDMHSFGGIQIQKKKWTPDEILEFVKSMLVECGKTKEDAYMIQTKNGNCIVTSPFNLRKAQESCSMLYEGERNTIIGSERNPDYRPNKDISALGYRCVRKKINGWLIKDGMALLYCNII